MTVTIQALPTDERGYRRFVASLEDGYALGAADLEGTPNPAERAYSLELEGVPAAWEPLLAHILTVLCVEGARHLAATVTDQDTELRTFFRARDFTEIGSEWQSELILSEAVLGPLFAQRQGLAERGIVCTPLTAEQARIADWKERLWDAERDVWTDAPHRPQTWEGWQERWANLHVEPALFFIARRGDTYLAHTSLNSLGRGRLRQSMTAVRPSGRCQGIATALKAYAIEHLRDHGWRSIETRNGLHNAPMLAVNEKIGFRRTGQAVHLSRAL